MPEWIWLFVTGVTGLLFALVVIVMVMYHRHTRAVVERMDTLDATMQRHTESLSENLNLIRSFVQHMSRQVPPGPSNRQERSS